MTAVPAPPPGYVVTYSENFTKATNLGAWRVQPQGNAPVVLSSRFGLGVEVTGPEQWSEVVNTGAVIGPSSFMTALMYVPPGGSNQVANWPALWSTGTPWPKNGEIRHPGGYARPVVPQSPLRAERDPPDRGVGL
jgi:hypothetical protein